MKIENTNQKYFGRDLEAMSFANNYHRWIIERFGEVLGSEVLEAGAGSGNFTNLLLEAGVPRILALEPSANMYPALAERFRDHERVTTKNAFLGDCASDLAGRFDSAVYINVLEHVEHDEEELRLAASVLRPGGHVCIFVPALPSLFSHFDRSVGHWRRYTRESLRQVIERAGLRVTDLRYCDAAGILPWLVFFKWGGQILSSGQVSLYDRWIFPVASRFENLLAPPLGKNLLAIGKRS